MSVKEVRSLIRRITEAETPRERLDAADELVKLLDGVDFKMVMDDFSMNFLELIKLYNFIRGEYSSLRKKLDDFTEDIRNDRELLKKACRILTEYLSSTKLSEERSLLLEVHDFLETFEKNRMESLEALAKLAEVNILLLILHTLLELARIIGHVYLWWMSVSECTAFSNKYY